MPSCQQHVRYRLTAISPPSQHLHVLNAHLFRARDLDTTFEVILRVYVYSAVLAFFSRCKTLALMQHRPPTLLTGPNPMQPTAVDEALIGDRLRLSNARESWLGHSFLPVAPRGWPTTSSSSKSGEEYAGKRARTADAPRQQDSAAARSFAACRPVSRIAAGQSRVGAIGARRQSRNTPQRLRLGLSRMFARVDGGLRDRVLGRARTKTATRYDAIQHRLFLLSARHGLRSTAQVCRLRCVNVVP